MDHRGDDGNIEGLCLHCRSWDDVVVELLARTGLAAGRIPGLAGWVCGV